MVAEGTGSGGAAARAAANRRRGAARRRALLGALPDLLLVLSADGVFRDVQAAVGVPTVLPPAAFLGQPIEAVLPALAPHARAAIAAALATGAPQALEYELPTGGELRAYEARLVACGPDEVLVIVRDVTERARAERGLRLLAEAGARLAASPDYETTLAEVARLAVPALADYCIVDVVGEDGALRELAVAHADPAKAALVRAARRRLPVDPARPRAAERVLRSGRVELLPEITDAYLTEVARDPETLELLRALGPCARLTVPLAARGRTLGVLSLQMAESGRRYGPADQALAEELARRAALAVDDARLRRDLRRAEAASRQQAARLQVVAEVARVAADGRAALPDRLERVAELLAAAVGDACVIRLLSEDGAWLRTAAARHRDPDATAALRAAFMAAPQPAAAGAAATVLATGEPLLLPEVAPDRLRALADPAQRAYLDRYPTHSLMLMPLAVRGRAVGTLRLARDQSPEPFAADDERLARAVAEHVAQAIDNARLAEAAEAAGRQREEFVSIASHELRTPLTTIKGYAQRLAREVARPAPDLARLAEAAGQLAGQVGRLEALVADLLDAARIRQGRLELRPEPTDLAALARQVLAREAAGASGAGRRLALDAPRPVIGVWDPARLDQVLTNLVSNALKYSPDGGEVRVRLRADRRAGRAELVVSDAGVGMTADERAELFRPFARGAAGGRGIGGVGLGLYIAARIVDGHGGTIAVESEPGRGSTFTVRLPLAPPAPEAAAAR